VNLQVHVEGIWDVKFSIFGWTYAHPKGSINRNFNSPEKILKFSEHLPIPGPVGLVLECDGESAGLNIIFEGFPIWGYHVDIKDLVNGKIKALSHDYPEYDHFGVHIKGLKISLAVV